MLAYIFRNSHALGCYARKSGSERFDQSYSEIFGVRRQRKGGSRSKRREFVGPREKSSPDDFLSKAELLRLRAQAAYIALLADACDNENALWKVDVHFGESL